MQRHTSIHHGRLVCAHHTIIHQAIQQTECYGLVTYQRLVVRLGIGHRLNRRQAIGHNAPHLPDVPILVGRILKHTNPEVGNSHTQAVVESHAAILYGTAHTRHTAHILGNSHRLRTEVVRQAVCKCKVCHGVEVNTLVEEFFTRIEVYISAMIVQHRGHTIEAEAVEVILIEPIFHIRQEEVLHTTLAVVENH